MLEAKLEKWITANADASLPVAIVLPSGRRIELATPAKVVIRLHELSAIRHLLNPTISTIGSAYVEGQIDLDGKIEDIVDMVIELAKTGGGSDFEVSQAGFFQRLKAHTRRRDKEAIEFHYDISNDFYKLFLDERMVYSCAYFKNEADTLDQAQLNKLDHILNKVQLKEGDSFLDIGCGWGALIIRAAQRGAKAVGVTLSQSQFDYAKALIEKMGLTDRCEIRLQDYRDIPTNETYQKIASVGMFEHVGRKNLPEYFAKMQSLLAPGGAMLMHGITAAQPGNKTVGRGGGDFIDKYVFPDGELPHLSLVLSCMSEAGFEVVDVESLRRHYARTLALWSNSLEAKSDLARSFIDEKRFRIWRVYLTGCGYAFHENWMHLNQILCCKLTGENANPFPMTRSWMYKE